MLYPTSLLIMSLPHSQLHPNFFPHSSVEPQHGYTSAGIFDYFITFYNLLPVTFLPMQAITDDGNTNTEKRSQKEPSIFVYV